MDSLKALQCYEHISKLAYDTHTHARPIWKLRFLTEKHYASRLAKFAGILYREIIINGVRNVGLSTYLDYHHYLEDGYALIPVDLTVTTTVSDMKLLVGNCIEKLFDQNLFMTVRLVFEDSVANGIFTFQNLRRWRSSVKIVIEEYGRRHDKGYIYFENETKLQRNGASCMEKVVKITGLGYRIVSCVCEIVEKSHEFMRNVNNSLQRFPNHYPFWRLWRDEKTFRTLRCYYTPTEAEKRQNQVFYGGVQKRQGTINNSTSSRSAPSRSSRAGNAVNVFRPNRIN